MFAEKQRSRALKCSLDRRKPIERVEKVALIEECKQIGDADRKTVVYKQKWRRGGRRGGGALLCKLLSACDNMLNEADAKRRNQNKKVSKVCIFCAGLIELTSKNLNEKLQKKVYLNIFCRILRVVYLKIIVFTADFSLICIFNLISGCSGKQRLWRDFFAAHIAFDCAGANDAHKAENIADTRYELSNAAALRLVNTRNAPFAERIVEFFGAF